MSDISVAIISKNEEHRIEQTLKSVGWADEIVLVDSGSSDGTIHVAKKYTDKIYQRNFDDFSSQKNYAISKCNSRWILSVDCDEIVSEDLRDSIRRAVAAEDEQSAFRIKRVNRLFGRILDNSAGADFPIRLFRKDKGRFIQPIHEFLRIDGKIGHLDGELFHNSTVDVESEFRKTEEYTELEARWLLERNIRPGLFRLIFYPVFMFLRLYIVKKGILDGKEGLLYAAVSARYSFIKYLKARRLARDTKFLEELISKRFDVLSERFPVSLKDADFRLNKLFENLPDLKGKQILEIGCGKGRFTGAVCGKGAGCIGIDVSKKLLSKAVESNKGAYLQASATELPFRKGSFDAAFCVEVAEHIPDLDMFFREASRVLKKNGTLIVIDKNLLSLSYRRYFVPNAVIKKYHEAKNDWMYPKGFAFTEKWFTRGGLAGILGKKFHEVESEYIISDPEKNSGLSFLFEKVPASRCFILWKAKRPKVKDEIQK
jgi:ubiquinone/menaquinone biosynthesis C-methylase UbiE